MATFLTGSAAIQESVEKAVESISPEEEVIDIPPHVSVDPMSDPLQLFEVLILQDNEIQEHLTLLSEWFSAEGYGWLKFVLGQSSGSEVTISLCGASVSIRLRYLSLTVVERDTWMFAELLKRIKGMGHFGVSVIGDDCVSVPQFDGRSASAFYCVGNSTWLNLSSDDSLVSDLLRSYMCKASGSSIRDLSE